MFPSPHPTRKYRLTDTETCGVHLGHLPYVTPANRWEGKQGVGQMCGSMIKCAWQDGSTKRWKCDLYPTIVFVSKDLFVEASRPKTKDTSVPGMDGMLIPPSKRASVLWKVRCFEILRHVVEIPPFWKTGLAWIIVTCEVDERYGWRTIRGFSTINTTKNAGLFRVCQRQAVNKIISGLEHFASNMCCLCVYHSWLTNELVFWKESHLMHLCFCFFGGGVDIIDLIYP